MQRPCGERETRVCGDREKVQADGAKEVRGMAGGKAVFAFISICPLLLEANCRCLHLEQPSLCTHSLLCLEDTPQ